MLKLDWKAALPQEKHINWFQFRAKLEDLSKIRIPRDLFAVRIPKSIQLSAVFADASEEEYGVPAYFRAADKRSTIIVRLLYAKYKVAQTKNKYCLDWSSARRY